MHWLGSKTVDGIEESEFLIEERGRRIPGVVWCGVSSSVNRPLVLVGHGGSHHKRSESVLAVAQYFSKHDVAVAAIDGPIHGGRRADGGLDNKSVIADFRRLWDDGPDIDAMALDWRAALDALVTHKRIDGLKIGWYGLSMGTAYGISVCARDRRIKAALLGMWGTSHPHGDALLEDAKNIMCAVQFQRQRDDLRFTVEGQRELFDAIGSRDKELRVYEGTHTSASGQQLADGLNFLREQLSSDSGHPHPHPCGERPEGAGALRRWYERVSQRASASA